MENREQLNQGFSSPVKEAIRILGKMIAREIYEKLQLVKKGNKETSRKKNT